MKNHNIAKTFKSTRIFKNIEIFEVIKIPLVTLFCCCYVQVIVLIYICILLWKDIYHFWHRNDVKMLPSFKKTSLTINGKEETIKHVTWKPRRRHFTASSPSFSLKPRPCVSSKKSLSVKKPDMLKLPEYSADAVANDNCPCKGGNDDRSIVSPFHSINYITESCCHQSTPLKTKVIIILHATRRGKKKKMRLSSESNFDNV